MATDNGGGDDPRPGVALALGSHHRQTPPTSSSVGSAPSAAPHSSTAGGAGSPAARRSGSQGKPGGVPGTGIDSRPFLPRAERRPQPGRRGVGRPERYIGVRKQLSGRRGFRSTNSDVANQQLWLEGSGYEHDDGESRTTGKGDCGMSNVYVTTRQPMSWTAIYNISACGRRFPSQRHRRSGRMCSPAGSKERRSSRRGLTCW